ncbi:MAG: hypothetical protein ACK58T_08090, partial [Phycisphaerae bacterium]
MTAARQINSKAERNAKVDELRKKVLDGAFSLKNDGTYGDYATSLKNRILAKEAFRRLEEKVTRRLIVEKQIRA